MKRKKGEVERRVRSNLTRILPFSRYVSFLLDDERKDFISED